MLLNQGYNTDKINILNNIIVLDVSEKLFKSLQDFKNSKGYLSSKIHIKENDIFSKTKYS